MLIDFNIMPLVSRQQFSNHRYLLDECMIPECIVLYWISARLGMWISNNCTFSLTSYHLY